LIFALNGLAYQRGCSERPVEDEQQKTTKLAHSPTELMSTSALARLWVRASLYAEPSFLNSPSESNHPDNLP
jgi:hypothetical protein